MRSLLLPVGAVLVLALSGCGETAAVRYPQAGASFTALGGGGSGGYYELPALPPALDQERDPRCVPGQPLLPETIAMFNYDRVKQLGDAPPITLAAMDTMPAFDPERRYDRIQIGRMAGDRERMVEPLLPIDVGITDRTPQIITGDPEDFERKPLRPRYRTDEVWWCDPTGERALR